jgi:uncharacterized protein (DUF305 family)
MNKINYKIVSVVLALILIITYAFHWKDIFNHKSGSEWHTQKNPSMHKMPNGQMMNNGNMQMDMGSMTMNDMVNDLKGKTGKDLERAFLNGMIPHHQGAVDMARELLKDKTVRPEFVKFANEIISAQEKEIQMQNTWLQTMFK